MSHISCHISCVKYPVFYFTCKCHVSGVTCQVSCVWCHMSGVMCHLFYVRKSNSKKHHCPQVRCHVSLVLCQVSHDMGFESFVRCHLSPVTDLVPYVRCPVSCVTSQLSEDAQTEPTAPARANTLVMCLISLNVRCHMSGVMCKV